MKSISLILSFVICALVSGDPESAYCCKPGQGIFSEDAGVPKCVITTDTGNVTTPPKLSCKEVWVYIDYLEVNFTVTDNDLAVVYDYDFGTEFQHEGDQFCVANETIQLKERVLVICKDDSGETIWEIDQYIFGCFMIVSVIFFIITAVVYSVLPKLRDLQGKSLASFCISFAIALAFLANLKMETITDLNSCAAKMFIFYYFILASFFWTNATSIQILLGISRPILTDYRWKPFAWYALYAWGCPLILTICMATVNYLPGTHRKPGIGLYDFCWFYNKYQQFYYMYSVMSILLLANICIFIYVSTQLCRHTYSSSHVKALRYKFVMTIRLVVVMGLPWIFEMISAMTKPHEIWVIMDIFNALQGLLIFLLIVVFRKRVLKAMVQSGRCECISGLLERFLAVDDDEEDIAEYSTAVPMDENPVQ